MNLGTSTAGMARNRGSVGKEVLPLAEKPAAVKPATAEIISEAAGTGSLGAKFLGAGALGTIFARTETLGTKFSPGTKVGFPGTKFGTKFEGTKFLGSGPNSVPAARFRRQTMMERCFLFRVLMMERWWPCLPWPPRMMMSWCLPPASAHEASDSSSRLHATNDTKRTAKLIVLRKLLKTFGKR